jgi:hypothetical protein
MFPIFLLRLNRFEVSFMHVNLSLQSSSVLSNFEAVCYIDAPVLNTTRSAIAGNLNVTNSGYTPSIHYH